MLKLKWIGQGGYLITLGSKTLCIDPYFSNSVFEVEGLNRLIPAPISPKDLEADMIITTHDHMDHFDEETLKYTNHDKILYAGPKSCMEHFKKIGIKEDKIIALDRNNKINLGETQITAVYADHTEDSIGVIVSYNNTNIYFVGDSLFNEKLLEVKTFEIDIIVVCINGKLGNMNYMEAAKLSKELGVKIGIPTHYGMFAENTEDPKKYEEELNGSGVHYLELEFNKEYDVQE